MKKLLMVLSAALILALSLMVLVPATMSLQGCASQGTGSPTTQSVDDEVSRWNASLRFWHQRVADLQIALSTTPLNSDTRDDIVKALQNAEYWLRFFEGATSQAATQPVPAGIGMKSR